jgi:hypothetical protein
MTKSLVTIKLLALFFAVDLNAQDLINSPAPHEFFIEATAISISPNPRQSAITAILMNGDETAGSLVCVGDLNYVTGNVDYNPATESVAFNFVSFDKCRQVATLMLNSPGRKVRFNLVLDGAVGSNFDGRIRSVVWEREED